MILGYRRITAYRETLCEPWISLVSTKDIAKCFSNTLREEGELRLLIVSTQRPTDGLSPDCCHRLAGREVACPKLRGNNENSSFLLCKCHYTSSFYFYIISLLIHCKKFWSF
jgi:hypothetical protein